MYKNRLEIASGLMRAISGSRFFYITLCVIATQAVWFIFFFSPWIFDEPKHLGHIYLYTKHLSPFLIEQELAWDKYGDVVRNGSYMFYYLMSWPARLFELLTADRTVQIILLRFVSLAFVLGGIVFFRKALLEIASIPKYIVNLVFLILCLVPSFVLLAGAVNYDNLIFLLFAAALYAAMKVIKNKDIDPRLLTAIVTLSLFASVVKWTSMALFLPIVLFIAYDQYTKHKRQFFSKFYRKYRELSKVAAISLTAALLLSVGLFVERPVMNTIQFGKPGPACHQVLTHERCMHFQDYAAYSEVDANKPIDFKPIDPISYGLKHWVPTMLKTQTNTLEKGRPTALPIAKFTFAALSIVGTILLIAYLKVIVKVRIKMFLLVVALAYTALVFVEEYLAYTRHGMPAAIRFRYLLPVVPIFIFFALASLRHYLYRYRRTVMLCFVCFLLLATQGGGMITNAVTAPEEYYWQNGWVRDANIMTRGVVSSIIIR